MHLQSPENSSVRGGEGEGIQFCQRQPDFVVFGGRSSTTPHFIFIMGTRVTRPSEMNVKNLQRDAITGDGMFHRAKRPGITGFEAEIIYGRRDACRYFHIRKFPKLCVDDSGGPLADKETSVSLHHKGNKTFRGGGFSPAQVRQFPDAAFAKRDAKPFYRADFALRISRGADERAKFHEGLVEMRARRIVLVHRSRPRPRFGA